MVCERCWSDAYPRSVMTGEDQWKCYTEILLERADDPCSPREQAGQYWDEERQVDKRKVK